MVSSFAVERRHSVDVQTVAFEVLQLARDCLRATQSQVRCCSVVVTTAAAEAQASV